MSLTVRVRRLTLASIVATLALVMAASPVFAETQLRHKGKTGTYQLNESSGAPVVTCNYDPDTEKLKSFDVQTPTVWSRPQLIYPGPGQTVGWKVIIQRKLPGHSWKTIYKGPEMMSTAWYDTSAYFDTQHLAPPLPADPPGVFPKFRVLDKLTWYKQTGPLAGLVKVRYDFYTESNGTEENNLAKCYSIFLH